MNETTLDETAFHVTPLGRMARWQPTRSELLSGRRSTLHFQYLEGRDGGPVANDGFTLSPENLHILREVG